MAVYRAERQRESDELMKTEKGRWLGRRNANVKKKMKTTVLKKKKMK